MSSPLSSHVDLALARENHFNDIGRSGHVAAEFRDGVADGTSFVSIASPGHGQAAMQCEVESHLVLFVCTTSIYDFHGMDVVQNLPPGHRSNWIVSLPALPVIPERVCEHEHRAGFRASRHGGLDRCLGLAEASHES